MKAYVGVTDESWYRFLGARPTLTEVNFWRPGGGRGFGAVEHGGLLLLDELDSVLRRLWSAVWDSAPEPVARRMCDHRYGCAPYGCVPEDLPASITNPYVLPYLSPGAPQRETSATALAWCREMFIRLGLLRTC